jgi:hypothetical protein
VITVDTVFVVGAGASVPFGMPTGGQLLDTAQKLDVDNLLQKLARQFSVERVAPLYEALADCQDSSIDALLEQRPDIELPGRYLIASLLLEAERNSPSRYLGVMHDWFRYIWDEMVSGSRGIEAFGANRVSFVTYNYDRILEHKMIGGLKARYRAELKQVRAALEAVPILHLHGSLGPILDSANGPAIPFGLDIRNKPDISAAISEHIERAAKSIRIVHQANPEDSAFALARKLLAEAHRVFFLGFGFGATNVERLRVRGIRPGASVICSAFQLTDAEQSELIQEPFLSSTRTLGHDLRIGRSEWDCRRVLRENLGRLRGK